MQQRLCFIGLGMMGVPMASNLRKAGYPVVVSDADAERVARFCREQGGEPLGPRTDLSAVDVVITMLPDSDVVESVLVGENGIARRLRKGATVIDMSTAEPVRSRELGARLEADGIDYLDAPVSGGVGKAVAGTLAIMAGGRPHVFERCEQVFAPMGARVFHVGPAGCGHAMKALNNYLSGIALASVAEALLVGERFGLDPNVMVDVFNASTGKNNSTENKAKQFIISRAFNGGFAMKLMVKDLGIATRLGDSMGTPVRLGDVCRDMFASALEALGDNPDHTEIYRYLEQASRPR